MAAAPLLNTASLLMNVENGIDVGIPGSRASARTGSLEPRTTPEEMMGIGGGAKDHAGATLRTTRRVLSQHNGSVTPTRRAHANRSQGGRLKRYFGWVPPGAMAA